MTNLKLKKNREIVAFIFLTLVSLLIGCNDDFLSKNPPAQLSEGTFWNTEKDATRALIGCYQIGYGGWNDFNGWNTRMIRFAQWTDIGRHKQPAGNYGLNSYYDNNGDIVQTWQYNYQKIARVNYFLANIDKVEMNEEVKSEMIAEVKFLRAYSYFILCQLWGDVPLTKEVLTFEEANSISRDPKETVVKFVLDELTEAANKLPVKRPSSEDGRIEKGAALTLKGRLLMAEKRWAEAAANYQAIIELNRYEIDPRFKKLFEDEGDDSDEIIFAERHVEDLIGEGVTQQMIRSGWYDGYEEMCLFQEFVDKFLMIDGEPIESSPLYDPENPFENRDPRLYATVLLPGYSVINGKTFQGHPDSLATLGYTNSGITGYSINKFVDWEYDGNWMKYGGDYILMRYAEVLLSFLESKIEAGDVITQNLLDATINKVRGRAEINMIPVTETNPDKLREIVRRERVVELCFEGGLRYWDLIRWGIAKEVLDNTFHGMKLTDNPSSYTKYNVNDKGYLISAKRNFNDHNYLWPIPLSELDVNKNLTQNPGYN